MTSDNDCDSRVQVIQRKTLMLISFHIIHENPKPFTAKLTTHKEITIAIHDQQQLNVIVVNQYMYIK